MPKITLSQYMQTYFPREYDERRKDARKQAKKYLSKYLNASSLTVPFFIPMRANIDSTAYGQITIDRQGNEVI